MGRREIAVNALLGAILLIAFAIPCLVLIGAGGLLLYGVSAAVRHFLPGLAESRDLIFYGVLSAWALVSGFKHVFKRQWTSAFVSFTIIPMIASAWFAGAHSPLHKDGLFVFPWFVLILSSTGSVVQRFDFLMSAFIVSACIAVNTGVLGSGELQQYAAYSVLLTAFLWFVVQFRRGVTDRARMLSRP